MPLYPPKLGMGEGREHFSKRVAKYEAQFLKIPELIREPTGEELKSGLPFSPDERRRSMLALAGLDSKFLKKAVTRLNEQLDATTTKFFSKDGKVVETREVVDHGTIGRAIDRVFDLEGARAKTDEKGSGYTTVNIVVAPWLDKK